MEQQERTRATRATSRPAIVFLITVAMTLAPLAAGAAAPATDGPEGTAVDQVRPTIGLVLAGGGAGGLAHVGVIRWLEENHVPVDLVAGTSMGGLIAALYATGSDAAAMQELMGSIDWRRVLSADTPYPQKAFRRKEDARLAPSTIELGLRDGFKLPPGFDAGQQVGLVIDRIAFPYSSIDSFDDLPTPFACVSVDLESGREVVFHDGPLALAMRATMSYPGWFSPVRDGDRVLVDGGVLNNLPTDVMEQMGADVIVAVDLGMASAEQQPFDDVLGVLNRTLTVMMRENTDRNAQRADVLVAPDVSAYSFTDFDRGSDLAAVGYAAAADLAADLLSYRLDDAAWEAYVATRAERRLPFDETPEFLDVEGAVNADVPEITAALDHHIGIPLDPDHLDNELTDITGWGRYGVAGYRGTQQDRRDGLAINVHEKTYGPPFIRPILDLRGAEFGEALITFGARFTFFDVAGTNSEWRVDATYGELTATATELYVPIGHVGFFAAPRAIAGRETQRLYREGQAVAEYQVDLLGVGADIGYTFGPRSELRFGFDLEYQRADAEVGEPLVDALEGVAGAVRARWLFDGSNSAVIPTRGMRIGSEARWIFAIPDVASGELGNALALDPYENLYQASLDLSGSHPLGGRFYAYASASGGTSFGATAPPLQQFTVGGPLHLGALGVDELRGSNYYLGRAGILWGLSDENRLSFFGTFYLSALYEIGDAFESHSDPFQDITFGIAGETLLGGVFVGGAVGQEGRHGFFFAIGRLF
jgi:NTE family protein